METFDLRIGVDVGQKHQASGLCVLELEDRSQTRRRQEGHFLVRYLQRLPAGASYPEIVAWVAGVVDRAHHRVHRSPRIWINATGLGDPILKLFREAISPGLIYEVYLNHGEQHSTEGDQVRLGKARMVSQLQVLLQTGVLHLPKTEGLSTLTKELLDFQIRAEEISQERYGAFPVGSQDELVTALGLAVHEEPIRTSTMSPRSPRRRRKPSFAERIFS